MSSTGRNVDGAERHADDFYETPPWVTRVILPHVDLGRSPLDPAAGTGSILSQVGIYHGMTSSPRSVVPRGLEFDAKRAKECGVAGFMCDVADALGPLTWCQPSSVIMNPPFKLAFEFVNRALKETRGEVVALLRLAFLESQGRAAFHRANPADVFVLAERPSFVEHLKWQRSRCPTLIVDAKGKSKRCELGAGHAKEHRTLGTDSCAYAWFRWRAVGINQRPSEVGRIRVLGTIPDGATASTAPYRR